MGKRFLVGVICSEPYMERTAEVLRGIISQAFKSNCDIVVLSPLYCILHEFNTFRTEEKYIYRLASSGRFDGFIYDRRFIMNEEAAVFTDKILKRTHKPVMMVDGLQHPIFENTAADDRRPFEKLVTHFIEEHSCKKIYCLTGPADSPDACERLSGYFDAMQKHGLFYDDSYYVYGDFWKDSAKTLADEIISGQRAMPDAVICGNDITAAALIEALDHGGISVPEDIAVGGFDCTLKDFQADYSITSYKRENSQLGADAFRRLYRAMTGHNTSRFIDNEGRLRIGLSCGCHKLYRLSASQKRDHAINARFEVDLLYSDTLMEAVKEPCLEDALCQIAIYAFHIHRYNRFYVCLTEDYVNLIRGAAHNHLTFDSSSRMRLMLSRYSSGLTVTDTESFDAGDILPELTQPHRNPMAFYITPLHSIGHFFGYAALSFGKKPCAFEKPYVAFNTNINNMLEHFRILSISDGSIKKYSHDDMTGLPAVQQAQAYFAGLTGLYTLLFLEITDIRNVFLQRSAKEMKHILTDFAEVLKSCLSADEFCGVISQGTFVIFPDTANRAEQIFYDMKEKLILHRYNEQINLSFTIGIYTSEMQTQNSLLDAIRQAVTNSKFTYTANNNNGHHPMFENLCLIRDKIRNEPQLGWSIDQLCTEFHISKSHLQKSYKASFGTSIIDDMIRFRLSMAKRLLSETELSVTEIAEQCGYSTYSYFTKQFKKAENMTPSDYRKMIKSE